MKALWKKNKSSLKENKSALKINKSALKIIKRFEICGSFLKMHKCPETMTGANIHFETVNLCIFNNNYALCILLKKKIPSSDDLQTYLIYCTHI